MRAPNRQKLQKWCGDQELVRFVEALATSSGGEGGVADIASGTILGRASAGIGQPEALSPSAAGVVLGLAAIATTGSAADLTTGLLPPGRLDDAAHGNRSGGSLHDVATDLVAGFMSAADKAKLDGVAVPLRGSAVITVPRASYSYSGAIAAIGVTPAHIAFAGLGNMTAEDENEAELLGIAALAAVAGTDTITVTMAFTTPASGAIRLNWSAI
jgi:hypothetical protein